MLVKPGKLVVDYLTPVTGISEADLQNVASNLVDAQVSFYNLVPFTPTLP